MLTKQTINDLIISVHWTFLSTHWRIFYMKSLTTASLCIAVFISCCKDEPVYANWTEMIKQEYCSQHRSSVYWSGISFRIGGATPVAEGVAVTSGNTHVEWVLCHYEEFSTLGFFQDEENDIWTFFINAPPSTTEKWLFPPNWKTWEYYEYEKLLEGSTVLFSANENQEFGRH